jgi:glycosyltransferase involved in cell wall biosynthesis
VKFWDVPPELVIKIFNPINVDLILKLADEEITENDIKSKIHKKMIVNIGRLEVEKNHMLLLKAVDVLRYERNDFTVLIIGDGSMRPILAEYVNSKDLADYVKFLGYKMNPYKYLKLAHTFVLPSSFEGFGIVLIEALCLQKNIVSTDISASREVLDDQLHGVLCQHTPGSMALALNNSLNVVGQKAASISQVEKYTVEIITDQYIGTFNGILNSDNRCLV